MARSIKKNCKLRTSKKKYNQKGGMKLDLDYWEKMIVGEININFNLLNVEDDNEISNIINLNKLDTNIIKTAISNLVDSYLDTHNYLLELDENTNTQISNWDIQIHLQPENIEFPFLCHLKFVSELQLNSVDLDKLTKVITDSDILPLELEINENTYQFNLIVKYSNDNNKTINMYDLIKQKWEDDKEIECGFTNGLTSEPRSILDCYRKLDCKRVHRTEEKSYMLTKFKKNNIVCMPKYSKFNFQNELIARETDENLWKNKVDNLCLPKDRISCRIGKNGCHWDKAQDRCVVNPADFPKRKQLNYY